jgi:hypothetical protein
VGLVVRAHQTNQPFIDTACLLMFQKPYRFILHVAMNDLRSYYSFSQSETGRVCPRNEHIFNG